MKLNLASLVLASAVLAAAAFTPKAASAAVLHVPFAFNVSGKTLPAGQYTVTTDLHGNVVVLKSADGRQSFNWLIGPGDVAPGSNKVAMRFDPSADGYTLRDIRYGSMTTNQLNNKLHQNEDRPVHVIRGE